MKTVIKVLIFLFFIFINLNIIKSEEYFIFDSTFDIFENFDQKKNGLLANSFSFYNKKIPLLYSDVNFNILTGSLFVQDKMGKNYYLDELDKDAYKKVSYDDIYDFFLETKKRYYRGFIYHLTLQMDRFIKKGNSINKDDGVYLILRKKDIYNYYMLGVFLYDNYIRLYKKCEAKYKDLADEDGGFFYEIASYKLKSSEQPYLNREYDIIVVVTEDEINPKFTLYIDGKKIFEAVDNIEIEDKHMLEDVVLDKGSIGIRTKNTVIYFDNFWIKHYENKK
jgi:hypothetical protein